MTSPSDGYRVTEFFPQCCAASQPQGYRVTDFFPKVKVGHAPFSTQGYRISPSGLPNSKGLNRPNSIAKCHEVTGLPLFYTSLLYMTREKRVLDFFCPFKGLYFSKFGNSVTFGHKPASALGNSGYRSVVTCGNLGNLGNSPRKHVADGRSLS